MRGPLLLVVITLLCVGFVISLLVMLAEAVRHFAEDLIKAQRDRHTRRADAKKATAIEMESKRIEDFRRLHPAQIVGLPDLQLLKRVSELLNEFIVSVKSYRPQISPYDDRFRSVSFTYPFEFFFPRENSADEGPEPEAWETKLDSLFIHGARSTQSIYNGLSSACEFPSKEPSIVFDPRPPPKLPAVQLPKWSIKIVAIENGREIDVRTDYMTKVYAPEVKQAQLLRQAATALQDEIKQKLKEAEEEQELMDLFVANQRLKLKELKQSVSAQFQASKKKFEEEANRQLEPIRRTYKNYLLDTKQGVEEHFSLGLRTLPLPLPPRYPWRVFYDPVERLAQVNQRVPFLSDIVVKRSDRNRAPAKRDVDNFLRRLIPAISLQIATNVAANDRHNHVNTVAVNCWSRYFERSTGKAKDAFVSSLEVDKKTIVEMNIAKADPLDAFRGLRGAFVYSTEEIIPIEPQIRLDKDDKRFVAGREVLEGMAQGQNLATMDWQDFEHLIRELLAKEYGKEGSDVRITRASRDRGVDAVVFDPDPLHGGKYVVQAKRYNVSLT
jgi:restriction system protein